jgi:CheY-like chemotaxis protein
VTDVAANRSVPVVEIGYRSAGAFLMAYVTQIVKGDLFIESAALPPLGTPVVLRLSAPPSVTMTLEGTVAWTREARGPGQPAGMSIALGVPTESFGGTVDRLSSSFGGYRVLLGATEAAPRAILSRSLRSIMTCTIVDFESETERATLDLGSIDLSVLDLDSMGPRGFELGEKLRQRSRPAPVLGLAQLERDRATAQRLGFDEALPNPPALADLDAAVRRALSRPATIHHVTKYGTLKGYG